MWMPNGVIRMDSGRHTDAALPRHLSTDYSSFDRCFWIMLTDEFLRHGAAVAPAQLVELRAGPLHLKYDSGTGSLRWFRRAGKEILRGIYFALRDSNWGTVPGELRERPRVIGEDAFRIEFECEHCQAEIHFAWRGLIEGDAEGTVRYTCDGEALGDFRRNRIGLCVLHPGSECAGARTRQIRTNGEIVDGHFADEIEPQIFGRATFRDLQVLAHEFAPGCWAELTFEGEVFEMEDQRNWTDASFKTYGTPLALPFPVEVRRGDRIRQAITVRLIEESWSGVAATHDDVPRAVVTLRLQREGDRGRMPGIGLGLAGDHVPLSACEVQRLRALRLSHVRHDLQLTRASWRRELEGALGQCRELGTRMELALHLPTTGGVGLPQLGECLLRAREDQGDGKHVIGRVLVMREGEAATSLESLAGVRDSLGDLGVPIGGGSGCNFCELNREQALERFGLEQADFLFWSVNPQVHATDSWSVMETLEAQGDTVRKARTFAGDRPLMVSPVTLEQRFNPVAPGLEPTPALGELPSRVGARQMSLFAAAWTVGSIRSLAEAGVAGITYFETVGWCGIMTRDQSSPHGTGLPAEPGMVYPVYWVFAALSGFDRWESVSSDDPGRVIGLGLLGEGGRRRLLVANLTGGRVEAWVEGIGDHWVARWLDVEQVRQCVFDPEQFWGTAGERVCVREGVARLCLPGYAVAVLERGKEAANRQ